MMKSWRDRFLLIFGSRSVSLDHRKALLLVGWVLVGVSGLTLVGVRVADRFWIEHTDNLSRIADASFAVSQVGLAILLYSAVVGFGPALRVLDRASARRKKMRSDTQP